VFCFVTLLHSTIFVSFGNVTTLYHSCFKYFCLPLFNVFTRLSDEVSVAVNKMVTSSYLVSRSKYPL